MFIINRLIVRSYLKKPFGGQRCYCNKHTGDLVIFFNTNTDLLEQEYRNPNVFKRIWNSWIPIPTGVGITLLAILQWRRLQKQRQKTKEKVAKDWEIKFYCAIPLRTMSRYFGIISETTLPVIMRPSVYGMYSRIYSVNVDEMAEEFPKYSCLSSFFTRKLKDGCRPIAINNLVSPADGTVMNVGKVTSCQIDQVKGCTYSLKAFLGNITWNGEYLNDTNNNDDWAEFKKKIIKNPNNELYQCVVYLAPGDYHRFHSPVEWRVNFRRHFEGELLSVSPRMAQWIPGLFTLNERVLYVGEWLHGYFSMTAVGATNVGSIKIYDDKMLHTNTKHHKHSHNCHDLKCNITWNKAEEVGEFRMGSTIVLIFEAPSNFEICWKPGDRVKMGEKMCDTSNNNFILYHRG